MSNDQRTQMRKVFFEAWNKAKNKHKLSALESLIVEIVEQHPEYSNAFESMDQEYATDTNPFLHFSLHLSLREQLSTNRPFGIQAIYQKLVDKYRDVHHVEHLMMDVMAHLLWEAQENGKLPSDETYLALLNKLV